MSERREFAKLPHWPRLLSVELAAAYLSVSPSTLIGLPLQPVRIGARRLYDRHDLDLYAQTLHNGTGADPIAALERFG